jgi:hypothetical protein
MARDMTEFMALHGTDRINGAYLEHRVFTDSASAPDDLIRAAPKDDPTLGDYVYGWEARAEPDGTGGFTLRYPARGDDCAVVEDDQGNYWVLGWTPYGI